MLDRLRALLPARPSLDPESESGRNGLAVLLSFVVAFVLWFTFSMRETYSIQVDLPIVVDAVPAGQALRARPLQTATVTLGGEGWDLISLRRNPPPLLVAADGENVDLAAAVGRLRIPAGVTVQSVQPRTLRLALDAETSRRLPIRLTNQIETEPRFGLLRAPRLVPDSVVVTGAQSILGGLAFWPTAPLRLKNVRDSVDVSDLALSDSLTGLVRLSVRMASVHVPVAEFTEGDRQVQVEVRNLPPDIAGVRFEPAEVRASYRVPLGGDTYDRAQDSRGFVAVADYFDIARDTTSGLVPIAPRVPPGLDVREVVLMPSRVEYFIQRRPAPAVEGGR